MKMKRLLIIAVALLLALPLGARAGFTTDADAIETAALSVLKLVCTNKDGSLSTGSGFVAFNSQTLVTNCHVMDEAKLILASDDNDNVYEIDKVYCVSESMDIAILGFSRPTSLKPLPLGSGSDLKRGEQVVAIGSPKGLKNTVSTGVVSAVFIEEGVPQIQITAPISSGSSGGALFDDSGRVVGITTSQLVEGQNLNFAVQGSVPLALYAAWKGQSYNFYNWPKESLIDFAAGEKLAAKAAAPTPAPEAQVNWVCPDCGQENSMSFCMGCGAAKPHWQCACGQENVFRFCGACGKKQESLLTELDAALALMDKGEFEQAAAALEKLGQFNCGSLPSQAGMDVSAETLIKACYYQWGVKLQEAGEYAAASEKYMASEGYADAPERIFEVAYLDAEKALNEGMYFKAAELYLALGDYKDAQDKSVECSYRAALEYIELDMEDEAIELLTLLEGYKDSADRLKDAYCHKGERFAAVGSFDEAIAAFEAAGDYPKAREGLRRTHYGRAEALMTILDYNGAALAFEKAGDYLDAKERAKEICYLQGERYLVQGDLTNAQVAFAKADDYPGAAEKLREVKFKQGEAALKAGNWNTAIGMFSACPTDDIQAKEKLTEAYKGRIKAYIDTGHVSLAASYYQLGVESGCPLDDVFAAAPGSKGKITQRVLTLAEGMGFIEKLGKNEDTYADRYTQGILQMETALGLTADGNITLEEFEQLEKTVYPGFRGAEVRKLMEKLCDLEYMAKLPDEPSNTYSAKQKKDVQKAEEALGLNPDGILTSHEQEVILAQAATPPDGVGEVKAKVSKGDVTLTWSKVKGARYYTVFRNSKQIGRTEGTKFTDKGALQGEMNTYEVAANKYTQASLERGLNQVYVEPYYESISLKDVGQRAGGAYIKVSGVRKEYQTWDGNDLIMLVCKKINGNTYRMYLRFKDYDRNSATTRRLNTSTFTVKGRTDGYKRSTLHFSNFVELDVHSVEW